MDVAKKRRPTLGNVNNVMKEKILDMGPLLVPKKMVDFNFSAARAYRLIGALVTTIGVQALGTGVAFLVIGNVGKARYERLTGRFVRSFSGEDKGLYEQAALLSNVSWGFLVAGAIIGILGIVVLLRPQLIHDKLRDWGLLKEAEYA